MNTSTELIPSISIAALLQARDAITERVDKAMALLVEADGIAASARLKKPTHAYMERYEFRNFDSIIAAEVDASAWQLLLSESGMLSLLDAKARDEWHWAIQNRKTAALTREAIAGTFGQLYEDRGAMMERGVVEVFKHLSWCYKSNSPVAFGRRIITRWHRYGGGSAVDDLWRIMAVYDGKPAPDHRALSIQLDAIRGTGKVETPYFTCNLFRNGNLHVRFTRPDLVDKVNGVLAKHYGAVLPPAQQ